MKGASPGPIEWVTTEQSDFFHDVLDFARSLPDDALQRDREGEFSRDAWDRCGKFGIQGLPAPERYGGGGAEAVTTMLGLEALGYGCTDNGLVFSINAHLWTSVVPLTEFGSEDQKQRWLPGLCDGALIGCHTITEPEAGSDAFAMKATGRRVDGGFVLSGRKTFVTNAPVADLLIVFARTEPDAIGPYGLTAFLLEAGTEGLVVEKSADKLGLRTSPMADVVLDDCPAPDSSILRGRGHGGEIFQTSMRWERACIMASQVGLMRRTMEA